MMHLLYRLRSTYAEIRGELGETGHGLVVSGREDELIDGSPAANVYGTGFICAQVGLIYFS
jgi:hypothetical protein